MAAKTQPPPLPTAVEVCVSAPSRTGYRRPNAISGPANLSDRGQDGVRVSGVRFISNPHTETAGGRHSGLAKERVTPATPFDEFSLWRPTVPMRDCRKGDHFVEHTLVHFESSCFNVILESN